MRDLLEIKEALRVNSSDEGALRELGRHYLEDGFYKQSNEQYSWSARLSPENIPLILLDFEEKIAAQGSRLGPRFTLAEFFLSIGEVDACLLELEEILEFEPQCVEAYNVLGKTLIKLDRIDEAIALLEKSLAVGIKDSSLTETLASAYLEKNRYDDAIKFYSELLSYQPKDKNLLRVLAELYTRKENFEQAARCYLDLFSDDPEVSKEVIRKVEDLQAQLPQSIYIKEALAEIYLKVMQPDAAVMLLREVYQLDPEKISGIIDKLRHILRNYPDHPQTLLALAEATTKVGNFSEAAELYRSLKPEFMPQVLEGYRKILELCPTQVLARNYIAEAYLRENMVPEALAEFEKIAENNPEEADFVTRKAREILKKYPALAQAHLVLGRGYFAKGEYPRTILEAEGIIASDPKYAPAYVLLGEVNLKQGLCRKAVENLHTALTNAPFDSAIHDKYREAREKESDLEIESLKSKIAEDPWKMSMHLDLANLLQQRGQREEAVRQLQVVLRDSSRANFAHNLLGIIYKMDGRFDLAAGQFSSALENLPVELSELGLRMLFNLGSCYEAQGLLRKALKTYEQILSRNIDFGVLKERVKFLKGTNLAAVQRKNILTAIAGYKESKLIGLWGRFSRKGALAKEEINLTFGQKHNNLGFDYFIKGMFKAALDEFRSAANLDPKNTSVLNNLSAALAAESRLDEALHYAQLAKSLDPASAIVRNNLGAVYYLRNEYFLALNEFDQAVAADQQLSGAYLNRGDLYYLTGKTQAAIEDWKRVGDLDPLSEIASQRLLYKVP